MLKFAFIVIKVWSTLEQEQEEHEADNNDNDNDDSETHKAKRHRFDTVCALLTSMNQIITETQLSRSV